MSVQLEVVRVRGGPMTERTRKRTQLPTAFPCGCPAIVSGRHARILPDGSRVCTCGRVWELAWAMPNNPDDSIAIAVEADHFREEAKKFKAQRDRALAALRDARPVVFNALCAAKADEQPWQVEVRQKILNRVDAEIDGDGG